MRIASRAGLVSVASIVVLSACRSVPQVNVVTEADAVRARSEALAAAEGAMNREKALTFWAQDAIVQPAGGPQVAGRDAVSALYRQFFETAGLKAMQGTTTQITVSRSGDLAYETGVNHLTFTSPSGDMLDVGKYLAVWKKVNDVWMVAALSFTSDAMAPVPVK